MLKNLPQILPNLIVLSFIFLFPARTTSLSAPTFNGYQYLELTSNTSALFNLQAQDWTASGSLTPSLVTTCGGSQLLAGFGVLPAGKYLQRYYSSLPSHNAIQFQAQFWIIDNWQNSDSITIKFDSQSVSGQNMYYGKFLANSNLCGSSTKDLAFYTITGKILHNAPTLTLQITSSLSSNPSSASFGVRDVSILLTNTADLTTQSCYRGFDSHVYGATGECSCIKGKYPDPSNPSSCLACPTGCSDCFGSSLSQCYICAAGYSFIQGTCQKCDNTCATCSGTGLNQCITCASGYWLQKNGTCTTTCNLPSYAYQEVDNLKMCITPCDSSAKYRLSDSTCAASCSLPSQETIVDDNFLCVTPSTPSTPPASSCPSGEFLYENDTICRSSCPSPFTEDPISVCKFPCPNFSDFYYYDSSCFSTCPSPLLHTVEWTGLKRCNLPCPSNEYLYSDGSCSQDCNSPYHTTALHGVNKCVAPCVNSQDYYYQATHTCSSTCNFPDTSSQIDGVRLCTAGLSQSEAAQVKELAGLNEHGGAIAGTAATIASVISSSNPKALSLASLDKMLKYIRYIGVNYPTKVKLMFHEEEESHSGISITFSPSLPTSVLESFPKYHLPENFEQYELPSSFLVNCWKSIGTLSIILLVIAFSTIGAHLTKKFKYAYFVLHKIQTITRWDFFLIIFYSSCDGFAFFSSMEFRNTHYDSFPAVISSLACIIANLVTIFIIAKTFYIIRDIRKTHTKRTIPNIYTTSPSELLHNKWENYHVIYGAFKNQSFLQQGFIFFYVLRIYLFNIIVGYLFDHPLCQAILIVLLSVLMLLFLIIKRPFHKTKELIQLIILETLLFSVNIIVLILAILDLHEIEASTSRENMGEVIIYASLMFTIMTLLIFIVDLALALFGLYKGFKTSKEHGFAAFLHLILVFFIPEGLEMEKQHQKDNSAFDKRKPQLKIFVEKNEDSQATPSLKPAHSPFADSPIDLSANDSSDNFWMSRKQLLGPGTSSVSQFARKRASLKFLDVPSPTLTISGASSPRNTDRDEQEFGLPRSSSGEKQQLKNDIEDLTMSPNIPNQNTLSRRMLLQGGFSSSNLSINQLDLFKRNSSVSSTKGGNTLIARRASHFSKRSETRKGTLELGFKALNSQRQGESGGDIADLPVLSLIQRESSTEAWKERLESWRKKGEY